MVSMQKLRKMSFSFTLAAMVINIWVKSDLSFERAIFKVFKKCCGILIKHILTSLLSIFLFQHFAFGRSGFYSKMKFQSPKFIYKRLAFQICNRFFGKLKNKAAISIFRVKTSIFCRKIFFCFGRDGYKYLGKKGPTTGKTFL